PPRWIASSARRGRRTEDLRPRPRRGLGRRIPHYGAGVGSSRPPSTRTVNLSRSSAAVPLASRTAQLSADLAERVGFEPTIPLRVCRISSAVLSTAQPPLRVRRRAPPG